MAKTFWKHLRNWIAAGMRQRITPSGFAFTFIITIVTALAFLTANNLLFLVLSSLLAAILVSSFVSRLSLAGLELDFVFPEHIPARRSIPARLCLRNEKTWMPSFSIFVRGTAGSVYSSVIYFPILPAGATVEETVDVSFQRRGKHSENSFELSSRFPFGFSERRVQVTLHREVVVYPCLDPLPKFEDVLAHVDGELAASVRGPGYDFYRIRPYEHAESARHVDWRATAHVGQLQIREFAREQEPLVEVFFDLNVPYAAYEWFEKAVDCVACLCWRVSERGARLRFRSQELDLHVPSEADVYTVLKYLALIEPKRYTSVLHPGREESLQVVFAAIPARALEAGWQGARMIGIDSLNETQS